MKPTSFEHACELRGYDARTILPDISNMPEWLAKKTIATIKLDVIADAIKQDCKSNKGDWRWFPIFYQPYTNDKSGFGFSLSGHWRTGTFVGARREFISEEDADYFGTEFLELHREEKCI